MKTINEILAYHKEVLKTATEKEKGALYNSIGQIYYYKGKAKTAIKFFKLAIEIDKKYDLKSNLAIDYLNLGNAYRVIGDFEKAKEKIKKGLHIALNLKDAHWIALGYKYLALYYQAKGNLDMSKAFLDKSSELLTTIGELAVKKRMHKILYIN
ncbi:tetratricopeptide repeat protein [Desulfurella sp.]|uniref:tetratricopeptide repeat protein n=1 Tax=Desulfurella sp. TaxID=1962857 RepID=UPI0025C43EF1|nr:tetratricopeptide repeat protein [Desulfurella sp.]